MLHRGDKEVNLLTVWGNRQKWMIGALLTVFGMAQMIASTAWANDSDFKCLEGATSPAPYKPGNVVQWCQISRDGRLLYHGSVWRWYPSGKLQGKEWYVFGNAEGEWPSWYENGKMSSLGTFKDGEKTGNWKYWSESGDLTTEVDYSGSVSRWKEYYPGNRIKATGSTFEGEKFGSWVYWSEGGAEKARCDFGDGLYTLTTADCRVIAGQLPPKGYSRPIPRVSFSGAQEVSVRLAGDTYGIVIPKDWKPDVEAAKKEAVTLALVPTGGAWRDSGPSIYVRFLPKNGKSFRSSVALEQKDFEENVADYKKTAERRLALNNFAQALSMTISYKPTVTTDSPFSIVADNTVHEELSYVDISANGYLMAVLSCNSDADLKAASGALDSLLNSLQKGSGIAR
jgi:MORN repeat protein